MTRMDSKFAPILAFGLLALGSSLSASAQDPVEKADKIVLEEKAGSVLSSTGAQYQSASVGKLFINGESMMLGDEAKATVVYYYLDSDGDLRRKCTEKYVGPNTFTIDDSCKKGVWWTEGSGTAGGSSSSGFAGGAGVIIGAGVIGAAILEGMDDTPPPVSAGPNL